MFRMFYNCQSTGDRIDSAEAIPAEKETVIDVAPQILLDSGDFFGVEDATGRALQFMVEADARIWMEIAAPKERGSYGCYISIAELEPLLLAIPALLDPKAFPKLEFSAW